MAGRAARRLILRASLFPVIYVTGHRNPDTDSIAAAVGYAELMCRVDPHNEYLPVRLGELNEQTRWVLDRAGAREPEFLPHVMLRVSDVMRREFPQAGDGEPVREVGRLMAREDLDLVPIVDDDGVLVGVLTERALARRYIRESREPSELDAPTKVSAIARMLGGRVVCGDEAAEVSGQIWCLAMDVGSLPSEIGAGDVVVVGDRDDAQRAAVELGVGLLVTSNETEPAEGLLALAGERGVVVMTSPLDSYVTGRMITLSAPCRALINPHPLTVHPDDLLSDIADEVKEVHYRAAVAVDTRRHPIGLITRSDLVNPSAAPRAARRPRRAGAERARRRGGRDRRDPRPPPHRLDRDHDPGAGDVRPGRLDGDAGDRALPPERHGAEPLDRGAAARRDPLRHGHPQLPDHDRARPRRGRVPRAGAGAGGPGVRPRDVRQHVQPGRRPAPTRS